MGYGEAMNFFMLSLALSASPAAPAPVKAAAPPAAAKAHAEGESCEGEAKVESGECHHAPTTATAPAKAENGVMTRGDKLQGLTPVTLEALLANPAEYDGKAVAVTAKVRRACERKGCWMELAASEAAPGVRVTFKDYGFFVPLDSAGSTAKVEGTVKVAELSPERAKHYESEGAKVAKDKSGKYREVQLVASGLELRK